MDEISIQGLEFYAYHGVYAEETRRGQNFSVDCNLYFDFSECAASDDLEATVDYGKVCEFITEYLTKNTFKLIETASMRCTEAVMEEFERIQKIRLRLYKPEAPVDLPFNNISVCTERERKTVYLSIGSNMGNKKEYLDNGIKMLNKTDGVKVLDIAEYITTEPYGGIDQDYFINSAVKISTILSPHELLAKLHEIESENGRVRTIHWGPRTLDMDIVFFGTDIISEDDLIIPHVDMQNRDFVLRPLKQIAPNFRHPVLGKTVTELLNKLEQKKEA